MFKIPSLKDHPEWAKHLEVISEQRRGDADDEARDAELRLKAFRGVTQNDIEAVAAQIVADGKFDFDELPDDVVEARNERKRLQQRKAVRKEVLKKLDEKGTELRDKCSQELEAKHGFRDEYVKRLRAFHVAFRDFVARYESLCELPTTLANGDIRLSFPCVGNGHFNLGPIGDIHSIAHRWLVEVREAYPELADEFQPQPKKSIVEKMFG